MHPPLVIACFLGHDSYAILVIGMVHVVTDVFYDV